MKLLTLCFSFFSLGAQAFVLLNPKFELRDPATTKVKISSEGCTGNGVSDATLQAGLEYAIEFWNDVPESRLKLSYGGKSSASLTDPSIPENEIIVGCGALPATNILGGAQHDRTHGAARVTLNRDVFTGNFNVASFHGTIVHEIGHGLGLNHSNDPASVMTYASHGWVDKPNYISQDDVDGIVYLYPNKSELGGFLGSCSSFASESALSQHFLLEFMLSFWSVIGVSLIIRKSFKAIAS